jgi:glutathione S-transferase
MAKGGGAVITLYDNELSGNGYKVRLFLHLLELPYARKTVDLFKGEGQTTAFLALNPLGQVPVLLDDDVTLRDSHGILTYLALHYGNGRWISAEPVGMGRVVAWLANSANELQNGPGAARLVQKFKIGSDLKRPKAIATRIFAVMEAQLRTTQWLVGGQPTIADIACFPYTKLAPEGDISLEEFPAIRRWLGQVEQLPGFVPMVSGA